jgi:alkaline phosphatase D
MSRRLFLRTLARTGGGILAGAAAPALVRADSARPSVEWGAAVGDVTADRALVWSRTDRPARILVEYATTPSFRDARRVRGSAALDVTGYTARVDLAGLPPGQTVAYRVTFESLADWRIRSEPVAGTFRTPPADTRDVTFAWSADTVGQGWGIDRARGGMTGYETIRRSKPDFYLNSGDLIYPDNPLLPEVTLDDGSIWRNVVTEAKSKVAETLDDYRGNYLYNLLDENLRRFQSEVPLVVQWDDHEVLNNWYPTEALEDPRYKERSVALLAARARRAFLEFQPIPHEGFDEERIFRTIRYGPLVEVFVLDMRSYRGPNVSAARPDPGPDDALLGEEQARWLAERMRASTATWKVVANDVPLGLVVRDQPTGFDGVANGDGPPIGREREIATLLSALRDARVRNVVWLTADVHHAAALHYHPDRARFRDFLPFREYVAGPRASSSASHRRSSPTARPAKASSSSASFGPRPALSE